MDTADLDEEWRYLASLTTKGLRGQAMWEWFCICIIAKRMVPPWER